MQEIASQFRRAVVWPPPQAALPILLIGGPRGSGRTTLLRDLHRLAGRIHSGFVPGADDRIGTAAEVMSVVVWQLMKKQPRVGDLRFTRFLLGRFAVERLGRSGDRRRAGAEMTDLLRQLRRGRLPTDVAAFAERSIDLAVQAGHLSAPPGLGKHLLSLVGAMFSRWRMPAEAWWAACAGSRSGADALVELGADADSADPDRRRGADRRLLCALLDDLREDYAPRRRDRLVGGPHQGAVAAVALLDDVDLGAGSVFLRLLADVRREPDHPLDPLLVVATTGSPVLDFDFRRAYPPKRSGWRLPVAPIRMPDLAAAARSGPPAGSGSSARSTPATRSSPPARSTPATRSSPAARSALAAGSGPSARSTPAAQSSAAARSALAARVSAGHPGGFAALRDTPDAVERLLAEDGGFRDTLLAAVPREHLDRLVTCAALRELTRTTEAAALAVPPGDRTGTVRDLVVRSLWAAPDRQAVVVHPWLRRVLLLALRHRPAGHPDGWAAVHRRLASYFRQAGDHDGVFYHSLALTGFEDALGLPPHRHLLFVSRHLRRAALQPSTAETVRRWLDCLDAVTQAPNAVATAGELDEDRLFAGFPAEPVTADVARLVVGEWLRADPLCGDPTRRLRWSERRYGELARTLHTARSARTDKLTDALYTRADELLRECRHG